MPVLRRVFGRDSVAFVADHRTIDTVQREKCMTCRARTGKTLAYDVDAALLRRVHQEQELRHRSRPRCRAGREAIALKIRVSVVRFRDCHQNLTPNPSRLGVSISASRKPRGVRAHSARAQGGHGLSHRAASSTLFCPLFSQNLHQLFRRGTRTLTFFAIAYVRASLQGFPADLDRRCMSRTSVTVWLHTALHTALRVPAYPRVSGRRGEAHRIVPP